MSKSILSELTDILGETASTDFEPKHFLDTGFAPLNRVISGSYDRGMPSGRVVEMFGMPSCGKTAISTMVMQSAIAQDGFAIFNDHERSFHIVQARALGLQDTGGRFAYQKPETLEASFSTTLNAARKIRELELISPDAPIVAVFDSLAAMVPMSKWEKELTDLTMADSLALAKGTSTTLPAVNQAAEKYNMLVLILNQLRENPGISYGDSSRTPGGKAPAYYASVRIKLTASKLVKGEGKDKVLLGQQIKADIIKNKITRPFQVTSWNFLYQDDGTGKFDVVGSTIDHMVETGLLVKDGHKIAFDGKEMKRDALVAHVEKNSLLPALVDICRASTAA